VCTHDLVRHVTDRFLNRGQDTRNAAPLRMGVLLRLATFHLSPFTAKIMPLSRRQPIDRRLYPVPSEAVTNRFGGCQMKRRVRVEFTDDTDTRGAHTSGIDN
jgi:hypothetical protein